MWWKDYEWRKSPMTILLRKTDWLFVVWPLDGTYRHSQFYLFSSTRWRSRCDFSSSESNHCFTECCGFWWSRVSYWISCILVSRALTKWTRSPIAERQPQKTKHYFVIHALRDLQNFVFSLVPAHKACVTPTRLPFVCVSCVLCVCVVKARRMAECLVK